MTFICQPTWTYETEKTHFKIDAVRAPTYEEQDRDKRSYLCMYLVSLANPEDETFPQV